jgi:hypothetical protein
VVRQALAEGNEAKIRNAAKMVLHYDDPGPGGFYDDVGWPNDSKHLVSGETLWAFDPFSGPAKLSYYNHALSMGKGPPVAFEYDGLDPAAQYVVRISVGAHIDEERPALKGIKLSEGLKADETVISDGFPVPTDDVIFQEFDIPKELTQDGKLKITLTPSPGPMPITGCAEIWLMQKDKMSWTARP